ncbi:hypothetical protein MMC29_001855 [Sticta canariensis]|nr:hypothetical protein [Sticta canariensis]
MVLFNEISSEMRYRYGGGLKQMTEQEKVSALRDRVTGKLSAPENRASNSHWAQLMALGEAQSMMAVSPHNSVNLEWFLEAEKKKRKVSQGKEKKEKKGIDRRSHRISSILVS